MSLDELKTKASEYRKRQQEFASEHSAALSHADKCMKLAIVNQGAAEAIEALIAEQETPDEKESKE